MIVPGISFALLVGFINLYVFLLLLSNNLIDEIVGHILQLVVLWVVIIFLNITEIDKKLFKYWCELPNLLHWSIILVYTFWITILFNLKLIPIIKESK